MTEAEKQLIMLRELLGDTGALHEAQVLQLKYWGALALDFAGKSWECIVDYREVAGEDKVTKIVGKTITYQINVKKKLPKKLAHSIAALDRSIHWLLGDDWALVVKMLDEVLYKGKRKRKKSNDTRRKDQGSAGSSEPA
jgi:hypothetical protein